MRDAIGSAPLLIDVGTDHALLPLGWLAAHPEGLAIGIDRAEMPLARAREHRNASDCGDRLELRLQDGLGELCPPLPAVISMSGMGGITIAQILARAHHLGHARIRRIVVVPNDRAFELRTRMVALGLALLDERGLWDRGRFYPVIVAEPGHGVEYSPLELRFGPHLLANADPALGRWLALQEQRLLKIAEQRAPSPPAPSVCRALQEVQEAKFRYFEQEPESWERRLAGRPGLTAGHRDEQT